MRRAAHRPGGGRWLLLSLFVVAGGSWARPVAAQFRYVLSTDVHEKYDSNVFAGLPQDPKSAPDTWDLITEIEPGFRAFYYQRAALLWLSYHFTFQAFARTDDRAAGRKLIGYANRLHLEYTRLVNQTTGIRAYTRFVQGTENVQVPGGISSSGGIESGFLTTGSTFVSDDSRLELQHLWSQRWSSRLYLDGNVYRAFNRVNVPNLIAPPDAWSIAPTHRLDYLLENDILHQETTVTTLLEARAEYPHDLATVFLDLSAGWRHFFSEFWSADLGAGLDLRFRQISDQATKNTWFEHGVGPLGGAGVRYRRGRELTLALEYSHVYALTLEAGAATSADTDQVAVSIEWMPHTSWLLESSAGFRYLRTAPRIQNAETSSTKVVTARASVAYLIHPGVSVDVGYDLELVRDRPALTESGQPGVGLLPPSYTRHLVGIGISIAWPPVPAQDTQLSRRASMNEPIFTLGPQGAGATELRNAEDELGQSRRDRAVREERARRMRQAEPDYPRGPVEELFDTEPAH